MFNITRFEEEWGGKKLIIETGKLAGQANAACTVQYGDTVVLATVCMGKEPREGIDYFPLLVDYEERLYAAGKIKGSRFIKREGRPSDDAVLTARLVDRSIRPLFDERTRNDVQVVLTVLSVDQENDPDIPALVAASCALTISDIPWQGPIAGIRIGQINNEWVINPSYEARGKSDLDLVVAGTPDKVIMVEAGAKIVPEKIVLDAVKFAQKHLKTPLGLIEKMLDKAGQTKRVADTEELTEEEKERKQKLEAKVRAFLKEALEDIYEIKSKAEREVKITELKEKLDLHLKGDNEVSHDERTDGLKIVDKILDEAARKLVLEKGKRVDGRKIDEIRPLYAEVGVLPRTHGSGMFVRGETQVLSTVTLGSPGDEQTIEGIEYNGKKRYMHHYFFPGFSVGEVAPIRGVGRREIGHGALAEKALEPVLPSHEDFPYTIRVVSEVLSSNGSTSQASTCGSSLSLMDAGVPIKAPVAGIAIGLISDADEKGEIKNYQILTDIQGVEDHAGDMDFKIAGTKDGITAIQMDTKLSGLPYKIIEETIERGQKARLRILETMSKAIDKPRSDLSPYAPRIYTLKINPDRIRDVIGPGGKMINEIIDKTGVDIDIENDGLVMITSVNAENAEKAVKWVEDLTREVQVGEVYQGKVTRLMDFGAIVEILPKQDGLLHISELAPFHVEKVEDVVKVGDVIPVKVMRKENGKISLSLKEVNPNYAQPPAGAPKGRIQLRPKGRRARW